MSSYFKLIDAIETPTTLNVTRRVNGIVKYGHITIEPNKTYELGDDEIFINSLKKAHTDKTYSKELENKLKLLGIPFKEKKCPTCGGRVKKLRYSVVEVVEDGN